MSAYQPELGQMLFGNPTQHFETPEILDAVLASIGEELCRVMWNRNQKEYPNPFGNTGNRFECETFKVHAYDWGDDDQPWNFAWRDLRVSWYKWMGRGMSANMEVTPDMAAELLTDCLAAVRALDCDGGEAA